jgi:transcriptional regulator with XRE-family HTH domain
MVGISAGALTNFEKGRRQISLDWLQKISEALDTPIAYFLGDERARKKVGDPRERRLVEAWRKLRGHRQLRGDFLELMKDLAKLQR